MKFLVISTLFAAVLANPTANSAPEPPVTEASKLIDCGSETPSKVQDCDKPDTNFCGIACCGVQVNVTKSEAAGADKFVAALATFLKEGNKTGLLHTVEGPDDHGFLSCEYTNAKGTHRLDMTVSSEFSPADEKQWSFLITAISHNEGNDNGQNYKLVQHVLTALAPLKEHFVSGVEYGCGMPADDGFEGDFSSMEGDLNMGEWSGENMGEWSGEDNFQEEPFDMSGEGDIEMPDGDYSGEGEPLSEEHSEGHDLQTGEEEEEPKKEEQPKEELR
jgi:hypothetical protein